MRSAKLGREAARMAVLLCLCGGASAGSLDNCGWIGAFETGVVMPDMAACDGGVCLWRFAYRSDAARGAFETMSGRLEHCLGAQMAAEGQVNHPDSYELRQFAGKEGRIYLSIKDKAALGETLVFLRTGP